MKCEYQFSVLRYVFDPITQEFVNVGVALYAPQHGFIRAICTTHYSRISKMFSRIDGGPFRTMTRFIQDKVSVLQDEINRGLLFNDPKEKLHTLLGRILPEDDSALSFVHGGVGITDDPDKTLSHLFSRYVSQYETQSEGERSSKNRIKDSCISIQAST
jgi:Protein of unknown function (DUF3037)